MNEKPGNSILRKLNKDYGSTSMKSLVQLNPYEDMGYYASNYRHCADRLVKSHQGDPQDDEILMPFLTLYRQAYELLLKDLALCVAAHQRRFGNPSSEYSIEAMESRIGPNDFGHKLKRSFAWVSRELDHLNLSNEKLPPELTKAIELLHGIDPSGTNFRYPDPKLTEPLNVDIHKLQSDLADGIDWLGAVYDHTEASLNAAPSLSDYM